MSSAGVPAALRDALADRYAIEREIGAGGMATVYLAEDLKHRRRVALKLLRPELGAVLGPERFLSEINVTANLQHPHLLPLFDSGEADGLLFYVMPYIEGESLRARLGRERQLPVDEAVRIATSILSALDYAHRHGVIHRDLKPENILLHDGQPLIADFGIALAVSNAGGARVTQTGLSLGTPQYMSPEQATGDRVIDGRSDIYATAAVLYEMLVGDPPHVAGTTQAIIAKVLTERPPSVRAYRQSVAEHVNDAIRCALEKLPADRFASAAEFADALAGRRAVAARVATGAGTAEEGGGAAGAVARRRRMLTYALPAAAFVAGAVFVSAVAREPTGLARPTSLVTVAFDDSSRYMSPAGPSIAISRDGSLLAMVGVSGGVSGILLRRMDEPALQLVRGTEDGSAPSFSPDGEWLVFTRTSQLVKVSVRGGTGTVVADTAGPGLHWTDDGHMLLAMGGLIYRVPEAGGARALVADTAGGEYHAWPHALPGGRHALITIMTGPLGISTAQLAVVRLRDGRVTRLELRGSSPRYSRTGHILFIRDDGTLYAAPFSLRNQRVTGAAMPVVHGVRFGSGGKADFSLSDNGTLAYAAGGGLGRQVLAVDTSGTQRIVSRELLGYMFPRVSPDGRRVSIGIAEGGVSDAWVMDAATGGLTRLTNGTGDVLTAWSPDGRRVAYVMGTSDTTVTWQAWDGSGAAELLFTTPRPVADFTISRRTRAIALRTSSMAGPRDILMTALDSLRDVRPFLVGPAEERYPVFSPDGSLLAYASDESGREEIYIREFPGPGQRIRVSQSGGDEPLWSADGHEMYYRGLRQMMAAQISRSPELAVTSERPLFIDEFISHVTARNYDLLPTGEFLMVGRESEVSGVYAIINWDEWLRRQTARRP